jgi:ABC-2 type transport system ATP-binding protein
MIHLNTNKQKIKKEGEKMKAIEVKSLTKTFKVKQKEKGLKGSLKSIIKPKFKMVEAVKGISFEVEEGEVLAFIGPNGAGKSTTIKMLTGILYPDSGMCCVMGFDPSKQRKKLAYNIGTVFGQKEQLWTHLTPYDNFKFFGAIYDMEEKEIEKRINELSEKFELADFISTPVRNLSLGQRIRCEIVASLIHNPKILFLDEPTIGLDPVVKDNIRKLIKQMNKEYKTTIFLTSHDVSDIEKLCKRVIIINNGEIVLDDSMENLKYHYLNKKLIDVKLIDGAKANFEEGITIVKNKGNNYKLEIDLTKKTLSDVLKGLNPDEILDINISNVPLEDTITTIYKKR